VSQTREWLRGSAKELSFQTNPVIVSTSVHVAILTVTTGTLVTCGVATYSGEGLYFANLLMGDSLDIGSHYYAKWTMLYGALADASVAPTKKTQRIHLVELES